MKEGEKKNKNKKRYSHLPRMTEKGKPGREERHKAEESRNLGVISHIRPKKQLDQLSRFGN